MAHFVNFVRSPRRLPAREPTDDEEYRPIRKRDVILIFTFIIIVGIALLVSSSITHNLGLNEIAFMTAVLGSIVLFITIGLGVTVGLGYVLIRTFLMREFQKRFERLDQERRARLQQYLKATESHEEQE